MPSVLIPLSSLFTHVKGEPTGIEFIDSTSIKVCHNLCIPRNKVFKGTAARGKGTMGRAIHYYQSSWRYRGSEIYPH